jgi:glycosyltransferase involved in cell wall biosynthesis
MPAKAAVAVLVPVLNRPENVAPLVASFEKTTGKEAALYFIADNTDRDQIAAIEAAGAQWLPASRGSTFAQKINAGYEQTSEPWLFVTGDDVKFHPGWVAAARGLSDRFDVIGTNDTPDTGGNPRVAAGAHADHFFIRRAYVDEHGGALEGLVCNEAYQHFYADVETIELAKARGVFTPCLASIVEHLHPDLGKAEVDETYKLGWGKREQDMREWQKRAPLVAMQRQSGRGKVRSQ